MAVRKSKKGAALKRWFKEEWKDVRTGKACGRSKGEKRGTPYCRPSKRISKKTPKTAYHERDLHPLLTYFVYANPTFSRGRSIFTKTIFHEASKRQGYNEWLHPDLVGVYLPGNNCTKNGHYTIGSL